jgi:hypothetical protein
MRHASVKLDEVSSRSLDFYVEHAGVRTVVNMSPAPRPWHAARTSHRVNQSWRGYSGAGRC